MPHWFCLADAIALEIAGTVSMKMSQGFTRTPPSVLIFVFYAASFALMTVAVKKDRHERVVCDLVGGRHRDDRADRRVLVSRVADARRRSAASC